MNKYDAFLERAKKTLDAYTNGANGGAIIFDLRADLEEAVALIKDARCHLPDCCLDDTCEENDVVTHADVSARVTNSLSFKQKLTEDEYIELADKIGNWAHKAVRDAIKDRDRVLQIYHRTADEIQRNNDKIASGLDQLGRSLSELSRDIMREDGDRPLSPRSEMRRRMDER